MEPRGFSISCQSVHFQPAGKIDAPILDGISLHVSPGRFVAIVGGNGAGKSSLLAAIAGEIEITRGMVQIDDKAIDGPASRYIDGVGIVHQNDEDDLLHSSSVAMNVAFRQANNGCHPARFWACSASFRAGLEDDFNKHVPPDARPNLDQLVGNLSGGNRQILNLFIAAWLEHQKNPCRLLLLDEHTGRLDHRNAAKVMDFTLAQVQKTGATALMVTHRYADALKHCDQIIVMGRGRIFESVDDPTSVDESDIRKMVEQAAERSTGEL